VIEFPNTYGAPLESGPLAIYENNVFVGEAMLPTMTASKEATNKAYVAYSVELKCDITQELKEKLRRPHTVAFQSSRRHLSEYEQKLTPRPRVHSHEQLRIGRFRVYSTIYIIDNKGDSKIDLVIEHPRRLDCTLTETTNLMKEETHFYRFNIDAPAKRTITFEVRERIAADEYYNLRSETQITEQQVRAWYTQNLCDDVTYVRLHELARLNLQRQLAQRRQSEAEYFMRQTTQDKERCQQGLNQLNAMIACFDRQDRRLQSDLTNDIATLEALRKRRVWEDKETKERKAVIGREKDEKKKTQQLADETAKAARVETDRAEEDRQRTITDANRAKRRSQLLEFRTKLPHQVTIMEQELGHWTTEVNRAHGLVLIKTKRVADNLVAQEAVIDQLIEVPARRADLAVAPELPERGASIVVVDVPAVVALEPEAHPTLAEVMAAYDAWAAEQARLAAEARAAQLAAEAAAAKAVADAAKANKK